MSDTKTASPLTKLPKEARSESDIEAPTVELIGRLALINYGDGGRAPAAAGFRVALYRLAASRARSSSITWSLERVR